MGLTTDCFAYSDTNVSAVLELTSDGALTINAKDINSLVTLSNTDLTYAASAIGPTLSVSDTIGTTSKDLVEGTDYSASGIIATAADSYTATILGVGNYTGTATRE